MRYLFVFLLIGLVSCGDDSSENEKGKSTKKKSVCECKENDRLSREADSTTTNECSEAFEALSREEKNEYLEEYMACK